MTHWGDIVHGVEQKHPFLSALRLSDESEVAPDQLPDLLKISIASAAAMVTSQQNRVAMAFPRLHNTPAWIAVGSTLASMRTNYEQALVSLPPLIPGSKVLVDGKYVALLKEETATHYKLALDSRKGDSPHQRKRNIYDYTVISLLKSQRLRIQATDTERPLSQYTGSLSPDLNILDTLLGISAFGNRTLFETYAILVSPVGSKSGLLHNTHVASTLDVPGGRTPQTFAGLLQWGSLRSDGKLADRSIGQIEAKPVLLLAPDMMAVRDYLRLHSHIRPLIILDGSSTIARREGVLDDVLDTGCPALVCIEAHEEERIRDLSNRAFGFWKWSRKDLHTLFNEESKRRSARGAGYFGPIRRFSYNFARKNVATLLCHDDVIETAAARLVHAMELLRRETTSHEYMELERLMHSCLLGPTRMLRPVEQCKVWLTQQITLLNLELTNLQMWIAPEFLDAAGQLIVSLCRLTEQSVQDDNPKATALRDLLIQSNNQSVGVLVSNSRELEATKCYWEPFMAEHGIDVQFFAPGTLDEPVLCDHLIICGWLNRQRMRRLTDGALASRITVLLYPFEHQWSLSAARQWETSELSEMSDHEKADLLSLGTAVVLKSEPDYVRAPDHKEPETSRDEVDPADFEIRFQQFRQEALLRSARSGTEETVRATLVRFSANYYAFLTDTHRLPVVSDIFRNEVDESGDEGMRLHSTPELRIGDYVVFREGARSNVLRELADYQLARDGKPHLRATAAIWKDALRNYIGADWNGFRLRFRKERLDLLLRRLKEEGMGRHPVTVRGWLKDDTTIGPNDFRHVLPIIARATGDTELQQRMNEVFDAISRVDSAHRQVAHYLKKQLFAALPDKLSRLDAQTHLRIELDVGSAVVIVVDNIGDGTIDVDCSKANCLLSERGEVAMAEVE